jgi:uncharacterized protein
VPSTLPAPRLAALLAVAALALALLPGGALPAAASDGAPVVISQVYGGGGNSGAPFTHDFVELRNRTDAPVSLAGRSIQYASATGTGNLGANAGQLVALTGTIAPGGYHLVQLAGGTNGEPLPAPDDTGTINMAGASGKVALVEGTAGLGCNGGSTPCTAEQRARIIDLVGYGSANFFEGSGPAPTLSNTTAALRALDGAQDTDDNRADFAAGAPAPRSSAGAPDPEPEPEPIDVCAVPAADRTPISAIQGPGTSTPIAGQQVVTRGIVTADFTSGGASGIDANQGYRGFTVEALAVDRDDDPRTSEGLFVFEPAGTFAGAIGDLVAVAGTAGEGFGQTQVEATDVAVCDATGIDTTLPAPADLPLPVAPDDRGQVLEPLESMRVTHPELTVVEFFQLERFGEVRLSSDGVLDNPTNIVDPRDDAAYEAIIAGNAAAQIILDNGKSGQNLDPVPYVVPGDTLRIGDQLRDATAVLGFRFGSWRLSPIDVDVLTEQLRTNRTRPRPLTPPEVGGTLTVASFNVLNYFNGDGQGGGFPTARGAVTPSELERQTAKLVAAVSQLDADIVGLIEIENDEGAFQATAAFVDALNAVAGEEVYAFVDTGVIGTDAIKQAFIYKPATVEPTGDFAILDSSVDPRFDDRRSRPALAQTFTERATGEAVTVVNNHLKSKGSACAPEDNDPRQGNCNGVRTRAAEALADWLATDPTGQEAVGSLVIGDINAYAKEDPIRVLLDAGYVDLLEAFAPADGPAPYSFTFDATQGRLDHALAEAALAPFVTGADEWHINADETQVMDYQESVGRFRTQLTAERYFRPDPFRSSDHDPVLVGLDLRTPPACPGRSEGRGGADGCPGRSDGRGKPALTPGAGRGAR